jgi:DNA-binding MarR family transcriptional regulator
VDAESKPLPDGRSDMLTSRIGYLLKHVHARFHLIQQEGLEPLGLTGRSLAVLVEASEHGPAFQQRIGERLSVDRTTMVALIDELESAGYVERHRDTADRRGYLVHVTAKGQEALASGIATSDGIEATFLENLPPSERDTFRTLMAKLV